MEVHQAVTELGGIAPVSELLRLVTRVQLDQAVDDGTVVRAGWARYALPTAVEAQQAARDTHGVVILLSAAAHWQWRLKWSPPKPQLAVRRGRRLRPELRDEYDLRWRNVPEEDVVDGWVASRERTILDCCVLLPFDQALAVTDSALRSGRVSRRPLLARVEQLDPLLRPRVHRVLEHARRDVPNPFESVLRAIALDIPGLELEPQVRIDDKAGWVGRVDLADRRLRIVLEADSMEYHGEREVMDRDCARYSRLVADGWLVLRFTWDQVMNKPDLVRRTIVDTLALRAVQLAAGYRPQPYLPRG